MDTTSFAGASSHEFCHEIDLHVNLGPAGLDLAHSGAADCAPNPTAGGHPLQAVMVALHRGCADALSLTAARTLAEMGWRC